MKKIILLFIICFWTQGVFAESISRYQVDMQLNADASVLVTETIDYNFDGQKHGIFRFIPVLLEVAGQDKKRSIDINLLSVKRDGQIETYIKDEKDSDNNYYIKIGNPDLTISGTHNYEIQYLVKGSLRYFDEYDEIYWNAVGDKWPVPISNIEVRVHSENIPFIQQSCYSGEFGSTNTCTLVQNRTEKEIIFTQTNVAVSQGMTVAVGFKKGLVPVVEIEHKEFPLKAFLVGLGAVLAGIFFYIRRNLLNYVNKYKTYDPVHARYEPPQGFDALLVGYLGNKKLDNNDIVAGIIELAQEGYISIERIEGSSFFPDDYKILKKKSLDETHSEQETLKKYLLDMIFGEKLEEVILLSNISEKNAILTKVKLMTNLDTIASKNDFVQINNKTKKISGFWMPLLFIICFVGVIIFRNPVPLIVFFPSVFVIGFILRTLEKVSIRYTTKGWEAKHAIEGFKLFLDTTEKDRLDFHNAPEKNPETFMKYLPFAIALGIEKKWAKQFEGIFIPEPEWFSGVGTMTAIDMTDSFSGFSQSFTSATTPSPSSSGSGGGGSSGGGGGGGGGGSW